jgi:hypothetical protein
MNPKRSKPKNDRTMPMIHPNAAAIDIGATMHMAAVRADRTPEPIRSFGTFTTDLHRLVDWFTECGVETVVMESTSVYWRKARYPLIMKRLVTCNLVEELDGTALLTVRGGVQPTEGRKTRRVEHLHEELVKPA